MRLQRFGKFQNILPCAEVNAKTAHARLSKLYGFLYIAFAKPKAGVYYAVYIHGNIILPKITLRFAPVACGQLLGILFIVHQAK